MSHISEVTLNFMYLLKFWGPIYRKISGEKSDVTIVFLDPDFL